MQKYLYHSDFYSVCVYLGCSSVLLVCIISLDSEDIWMGFASVLHMEGPVLVESWLFDRKGEIILLPMNRLVSYM